ncbi:MAG: prenyltransferase [Candidatus Omnitrophica bacterium]|nr:prenyltransferase [Candidatus Omnitrophota bacterium]MBU4478074.1 prenyltransferase [Candidatus Omnitrophota bacterium]MCG2704354.1 prenyltransferase [Candidatus Omnitrophota bacterium]
MPEIWSRCWEKRKEINKAVVGKGQIRHVTIKYLLEAMRLPFAVVSVIAFLLGSLISLPRFHALLFCMGLAAVIATHLGANLINDYADSSTGVDWQDLTAYGFFGGSKLIQKKIFSETFYLRLALVLIALAFFAVILLVIFTHSLTALWAFAVIAVLAWGYSEKPFRFSYHGLGEIIIFLLFGPALVMGGYFIQTGIYPSAHAFCLSLPLGFAVTAVLFANEIPDFPQDILMGKRTLVAFFGQSRAFIFYYVLIAFAVASILLNIALGYLGFLSFFSLLSLIPAVKAGNILRSSYFDKHACIQSSRLSLLVYNCIGIFLVLDMLL